jgi:hypothetical protein
MRYPSHLALCTRCALVLAGWAQACGGERAGLAAPAQRWPGAVPVAAAQVVLVVAGPWALASREVVAWVAPAAARPGPLAPVTWLAAVAARAATQVNWGLSHLVQHAE